MMVAVGVAVGVIRIIVAVVEKTPKGVGVDVGVDVASNAGEFGELEGGAAMAAMAAKAKKIAPARTDANDLDGMRSPFPKLNLLYSFPD